MRRLVVLVSSIVLVDAMLYGALTPLVPGYAHEFGLSKAGAGLLVAAFGAGAFVGGIPGGLAATRYGPRPTVLAGLCLFALASFGFAAASEPWALGAARFAQGLASTTTWAGALTWLVVSSPRGRRGELLGIAFGAAVLGAIVGPMFGAVAHAVGIGTAFAVTGCVGLALAVWAAATRDSTPEVLAPGSPGKALRDERFVGGLWLNTLPGFLFGVVTVLVPLTLDAGGWGPFAIGAVFFSSGLVEAAVNPYLGRFSDRRGRLLPTRIALAASVAVAVGFAFAGRPGVVAALVGLAAVSFGGFFTPGMALVADRAEVVGLAQGVAFGLMQSAWAAGNLTGPAIGGGLAALFGDPVPYLVAAGLCLATLAATRVAVRRAVRAG